MRELGRIMKSTTNMGNAALKTYILHLPELNYAYRETYMKDLLSEVLSTGTENLFIQMATTMMVCGRMA